MASVLCAVVEAVKDLLQAGDDAGAFIKTINPQRSYDAKLLLEDAGVLHVDVVLGQTAVPLRSRTEIAYDINVDIGVRKVFDASDEDAVTGKVAIAAVDNLIYLVEQINEYLASKARRSLASALAVWKSAELVLPWDAEHLHQARQFTSILRVVYSVARDVP